MSRFDFEGAHRVESGQKRGEAGASEVGVLAQRLKQAEFPHDEEAETIGERPLVGEILDECCFRFLEALHVHSFDPTRFRAATESNRDWITVEMPCAINSVPERFF